MSAVDDQQIGLVVRRIRLRKRGTQAQMSAIAGVSQATWSRFERGHLDMLTLAAIRAIARSVEVRLELLARWRGGDLDRMVSARHSALHESVARAFESLPEWQFAPEV